MLFIERLRRQCCRHLRGGCGPHATALSLLPEGSRQGLAVPARPAWGARARGARASPRFSAALASTGRAGNEGLNIRGLEGNQVLLLVDGVRVPQAFSFGAFAVGRGDYLFIEATQTAKVLRGPASTQFGSDGLACAFALRTLEPADLLERVAASAGFARAAGTVAVAW